MSDIVKIFALGGLDEDGKNMYVVEINDDIFVLEAGIKYPEKSLPGIDIIIPDMTYLEENKERVKAYIITHGHDDNMGSLSYAIKKAPAPVYCSEIAQLMIKDNFRRYRENPKIDFKIVESSGSTIIANRKFKFFSTSHTVPQSFGVAIDTTQGYIVYTGDFIIDCGSYEHFRTDLNAIAKIAEKKVLCLMAESTSSEKPDFASPNHKLLPLISRPIEEFKGRIVIGTYTQNLYAMQEIINLGIKANKKILLLNPDHENLINNINIPGLLEIPSRNKATLEDLKKEDQSDLLIVVASHGEKLFRLLEKIANEEYQEKGLVLNENDLVIMTAKSVPGVEVIAVDVLDQLYRTGAKVLNVSGKQLSAMHAREEDLKTIISILRPKYYLPVKGYYKDLVSNANIANNMKIGLNHNNILVFDNGMVVKFENEKIVLGQEPVHTGELMVDGLGIFDTGSVVINDRTKLADDGVIILGVTVDSVTKEIIAGPDVQTRGLVFVKDSDYLIKEIANIYVNTVNEILKNDHYDYNEKRVAIRDKISKYVKKEIGKDPLILSMIVEI